MHIVTKTVLRRAKEHLSDPEMWVKYRFFVGQNEDTIKELVPDTAHWAAGVSIDQGLGLGGREFRGEVTVFSDEPTTSHSVLMAMFDRAIGMAVQA